MRSLVPVAAAVLFAACVVAPVVAQEAAKETPPPRPAPGPTDALLRGWTFEGRKILAMAQDFPDDKYDFKPNPAQRSFAEQLLHVAGDNCTLVNVAEGRSTGEPTFTREQYKTKAEVVALLKKSIDDGAAAIKAKGDAGLDVAVLSPWGNSMIRFADFAYSVLAHSAEHYGQLVVYYRVNNMVPPDSRPR